MEKKNEANLNKSFDKELDAIYISVGMFLTKTDVESCQFEQKGLFKIRMLLITFKIFTISNFWASLPSIFCIKMFTHHEKILSE